MDATDIRTVEQLLAVALSHERHAAQAFTEASKRMQAAGRHAVADLFASLAETEETHVRTLSAIAAQHGLDIGTLATVAGPRHNWADDILVAGATLYDCLANAVRAEEEAFRFYTYVAGNAEDAATQALAERLSHEELAHAAEFRHLRRQAFHADKRTLSFWPPVTGAMSVSALLTAALPREAILCAALERHGGTVADLPRIAAVSAEKAAALQSRFPELAIDRSTGRSIEDGDSLALHRTADRVGILEAALSDASDAFNFYDRIVDHAGDDDATLAIAQALSEIALERLVAVADLRRPA